MVYYIRFLKSPRIQTLKTGPSFVSALISITTDLGDAFLPDDVTLDVVLEDGGSNHTLFKKCYLWEAGKRELAISLGPIRFGSKLPTAVLGVGCTSDTIGLKPNSLVNEKALPAVISGWSAIFGGPQALISERLIERRFDLRQEAKLSIWEESGDNIARHIWDAALAAVIYLQRAIHKTTGSSMQCLQERLQPGRKHIVRAVELGSGCGIVGIALAEMLPRCSVTLTDLPEVDEIVTRNLSYAQPASESTIDFRVLDWDAQPSADVSAQAIDLILVSDCTYNADSLPSLVRILDLLMRQSPDALILVALKRRHESEAIFFDLMEDALFTVTDHDTVALPAPYSEQEMIEIYLFGRSPPLHSE